MSNKDEFRYAVLSAVHDQGLSVGDAVDQAYEAQLAEIEQLNARIAELEKFVSACRYAGPDVIEQLRQEAQQLLAKRKESTRPFISFEAHRRSCTVRRVAGTGRNRQLG